MIKTNGVVLRNWYKATMDQVENYIGNIPVDIDLMTFYHFIDKLAEGKCSRIRFMISYGYTGTLPSPQYLPRLIPRRRGE